MSAGRADVLFILALSFLFVKYFFQVFSELFSSKLSIQELFKPFSPLDSNSFSLPHAFEFVKHFFQVFSEPSGSKHSIQALFKPFPVLTRTHLVYHALSTLSSTFSDFFQKSVQVLPRSLPIFFSLECPLVRRSDRIPRDSPFVNTFFHFFAFYSLVAAEGKICYPNNI